MSRRADRSDESDRRLHERIDDHVRRYGSMPVYLYSPHTDRAYDIFDRDRAVDLHRDISRLNGYDRTRRIYIVERVNHRGIVDRQLHAAIDEAREHTKTPLVGKWVYNGRLHAAVEGTRSGALLVGDRDWKRDTYFSSAFTTQDKELALREWDHSTPDGILFVDPDGYVDFMGADGSELPIGSRYKRPGSRPNKRFKNTFGPEFVSNEYLTAAMVFQGLKMGIFKWEKLPSDVKNGVMEYLGSDTRY